MRERKRNGIARGRRDDVQARDDRLGSPRRRRYRAAGIASAASQHGATASGHPRQRVRDGAASVNGDSRPSADRRRQRLVDLQSRSCRRIEAPLAILLETAAQQAANGCGRRRRAARSSPARVVSTAASVSDTVVALEQRASRSASRSSTHAERPDVRALVDRLAARLLGAHVGGRAEDHARLRHRGRRDRRRLRRRSATNAALGSIAFASPKSSTFTVPSARTLMFAGFRSRWMIPCSCAASSASAICFAIGSASSSGIAPRAMRCDRSSALDQFHHERRDAVRSLRGRRWPRCSDDSARRGLRLRAGSARADRGQPRATAAGS